jgi:hypothetical protein
MVNAIEEGLGERKVDKEKRIMEEEHEHEEELDEAAAYKDMEDFEEEEETEPGLHGARKVVDLAGPQKMKEAVPDEMSRAKRPRKIISKSTRKPSSRK